MTKLTTHVLDTTLGKPAQYMAVKLLYQNAQTQRYDLIKTVETNDDGRCTEPLLAGAEMRSGSYQLIFDVGNYFQKQNIDSPFLKDVVICFCISDPQTHYHVPLLVSPFSYSTYRGS